MSAPIGTLPAPVAAPARGGKSSSSDGGAAFGSVLEGTARSQRSDDTSSADKKTQGEASAPATASAPAAQDRAAAEHGLPVGLSGLAGPTGELPTEVPMELADAAAALAADPALADGSNPVPFDAATPDFATPPGTHLPHEGGETGLAANADAAEALLLAGDQTSAGAPIAEEASAATRPAEVPAAASTLASSAGPTVSPSATAPAPPATADAHTAEVPTSVGAGVKTPTELGTSQSGAAGQGLRGTGAAAGNPLDGSQIVLSDDQTQHSATLRTGGAAATAATAGATALASTEAGPSQAPTGSPTAASTVAPVQAAASVAPTQPVTPPVPTAATAQTQAPTYAAQVAGPVFSLASAGKGEHVMTVTVTPENLGPVTVRAVVGAESVRVELFAPTDAGRDALRAIMPDLRRDLAATGMSASLDLSSDNAPADRGEDAPGRERATGNQPSATSDGRTAESIPSRPAPVVFGGASTIDVMA
jgi:flagellar hook-length control protein FliK